MINNKSFKKILEQLRKIISDLENDQLQLNKTICVFEIGIKKIKLTETKLQNIKDKVTKIINANNLINFKVDKE